MTSVTFGKEVRVEQSGKEIHLIFVASTQKEASDLREEIVTQLKSGRGFALTLSGQAEAMTEQ